jgi:hypothetical protein
MLPTFHLMCNHQPAPLFSSAGTFTLWGTNFHLMRPKLHLMRKSTSSMVKVTISS